MAGKYEGACQEHQEKPVQGYLPCVGCEIERLQSRLDAMREQLDQYQKDAARYQYIRSNQVWHRFNDYSVVGAKFDYGDDFQAAIMLDHHIDTRLRQQAEEEAQ